METNPISVFTISHLLDGLKRPEISPSDDKEGTKKPRTSFTKSQYLVSYVLNMAGKSADRSMDWFHPPRMRKRGQAATCEPKRKRPLLEDPFEKCSVCYFTLTETLVIAEVLRVTFLLITIFYRFKQCDVELGGFLTHNPSARRPTVLLSCGHVVCPDCHYKMKKPCETGGKNEGIHRESQFSCKTCGSWVFPLYLPSLTDLDLPRCSTPNCKSVSQVFFCNHCRNNLCCECRIKHDVIMPNHHVIEMPQGKKNQQTSFSRKHIGCVRHSQRTTSKCTGCGDIVCNKCHFAYSDMIDGKFIRHDRADIAVADLDLENVMHNPLEYESRLYSMERIARRRRIDFQNQVDVLKNEVCVHFFNIINAKLKLAVQMRLGGYPFNGCSVGIERSEYHTNCRFGMLQLAMINITVNTHLQRIFF
uniref:B box-type domain-containing protein n=1 Tax=Heterorhabditis bacteriophora TaxID=37862 RepID=A0A1I7X8M4_HETBA